MRKIAILLVALQILFVFYGCSSPSSAQAEAPKQAAESEPASTSPVPQSAPASEPEEATSAEEPAQEPELPADSSEDTGDDTSEQTDDSAESPDSDERMELVPVGEKTEYEEGMYKVGADIPASTYIFFAYDGATLPSVSVKNGSGTDAEVLAVNPFQNITILAANEGEYLEARECKFIELAFASGYMDSLMIGLGYDYFIPATYLCGFTIRPGEYKAIPEEGATVSSITTYADPFQQEVTGVEIVKGQAYITIERGEYIQTRGTLLYPLDYSLEGPTE